MFTVNRAAELIGRSFVQTNLAVDRLVGAGVLQQVTVGKRNRASNPPTSSMPSSTWMMYAIAGQKVHAQ